MRVELRDEGAGAGWVEWRLYVWFVVLIKTWKNCLVQSSAARLEGPGSCFSLVELGAGPGALALTLSLEKGLRFAAWLSGWFLLTVVSRNWDGGQEGGASRG